MNAQLQNRRAREQSQGDCGCSEANRKVETAAQELRAWCREVDQLGAPRLNELGVRLRKLRDVVNAHYGRGSQSQTRPSPQTTPGPAEESKDHAAAMCDKQDLLRRFEALSARLCCVSPEFTGWAEAEREVEGLLECLASQE